MRFADTLFCVHALLLSTVTVGQISYYDGFVILDCDNQHDWAGISGDLVKFGLGVTSMVSDVLFLVQHYVLYRPSAFQEVLLGTVAAPYLAVPKTHCLRWPRVGCCVSFAAAFAGHV